MKDYELIAVLERCRDCDKNIAGYCAESHCSIFNVLLCTYERVKKIKFSDRIAQGFRMLSDEYEGE